MPVSMAYRVSLLLGFVRRRVFTQRRLDIGWNRLRSLNDPYRVTEDSYFGL